MGKGYTITTTNASAEVNTFISDLQNSGDNSTQPENSDIPFIVSENSALSEDSIRSGENTLSIPLGKKSRKSEEPKRGHSSSVTTPKHPERSVSAKSPRITKRKKQNDTHVNSSPDEHEFRRARNSDSQAKKRSKSTPPRKSDQEIEPLPSDTISSEKEQNDISPLKIEKRKKSPSSNSAPTIGTPDSYPKLDGKKSTGGKKRKKSDEKDKKEFRRSRTSSDIKSPTGPSLTKGKKKTE